MPSAHATADTAFDRQLLSTLLAFRKGDWSVRLPSDLTGISGKIADVLNDIIDANERVAKEFDRVSRVVGREGKLSQRAAPVGVAGGWGTMVQSINTLIDDMVRPTTEMVRVIGAVAKGDLSQSMGLDVDGRPLKGEFLRSVKLLTHGGSACILRVRGHAGRPGGGNGGQTRRTGESQGRSRDVEGSHRQCQFDGWQPHRSGPEYRGSNDRGRTGDLSKKISVDVRGEILELKDTINTMVDQLSSFASEVTRVAREVGTEGELGGQANVQGVAGTWKDLTDKVNSMAGNLTAQVRNIADVTTAVANGDLSKKITVDVKGEILELKNTINVMVDQLNSFASEVTRVAREVGTEGKLGGQARSQRRRRDLEGPHRQRQRRWPANLTAQVRNIAEVTTAVADGDLSKKITVDVKGEILELKDTINVMVDQLNSFAAEVTRVAREVGTEGKLGGQAEVKGVAGTWKDLTDNVNFMAGNLTAQVRNIAEVTTAVANGDLSKKITVDVKGEILELKNTINVMVDQLNSFASEVTRVAKEVGTEGKLGGQADVQGVAGTWKDLTDTVNSMAAQPHCPGAQHRRGDNRGGKRRSVEENHRRREG